MTDDAGNHQQVQGAERVQLFDKRSAGEQIRRDSHLALGCAFGIALLIVGALIILELAR